MSAAIHADPSRSMAIIGHLGDDTRLQLGQLHLRERGAATEIEVDLDPSRFVDKFLSMRPFKCLDGPSESICHLPYPYAIRNRISASDSTDLDYGLLFIYKAPEQYHAEFYNGLYFKFRETDGGFLGEAFEVDMNILMTPPAEGEFRPIGETDLTPVESDGHWLKTITIR